MKQVTMLLTEEQAKTVLPLIIADVTEITITSIPDPAIALPAPSRKIYRGDKTASDLVMEMFSEDCPQRSMTAICAHLVSVGFADTTYGATVSRLVADGKLKRVNRELIEWLPEQKEEPQ